MSKGSEKPTSPKGCQRRLDPAKTVFDNVFSSQRPVFSLSEKVWNPPADAYETNDGLVVKMEVAGVSLDTLEIATENDLLTIRGSRREEQSPPEADYHQMELRYGHFERVFPLSLKFNADGITARYKDGFLVVAVPKSAGKPHKIHVEEVNE